MQQDPLTSVTQLRAHLNELVLGQENLVSRLILALLCDGHVLVEGAPGLAKTRAVKALATLIHASFHRVQFTPDLLPADLTGTDVFLQETGQFEFRAGPLFHNVLLADEVNRAPAKVQSALLEAMGERQVTVGANTYPLPGLFFVMATQNPIEHEGTHPLPEAQLDRFMLHVKVDYPCADAEQAIMRLVRDEKTSAVAPNMLPIDAVFRARDACAASYMAPELERYIVELVRATRNPGAVDPELSGLVELGASPRASLAFDTLARAHAWLNGAGFVSPDDIHSVAHEVLRHRIVLAHGAYAREVDSDFIISRLLELVAVP
jgi:MoxR-like ATPase